MHAQNGRLAKSFGKASERTVSTADANDCFLLVKRRIAYQERPFHPSHVYILLQNTAAGAAYSFLAS